MAPSPASQLKGACARVACTLMLAGLIAACGADEAQEEYASMVVSDIDAVWDYGAPEKTRKAFISMMEEAGDEAPLAWKLELQTQIARTYSLLGEFDGAHDILNSVEPALEPDMHRARIRTWLERGRTWNSAGDKDKAKPLFIKAWELGRANGEDFLAIDAAHMVAIAAGDSAQANQWNRQGLELARASKDDRARGWTGSLTNNMGWAAFEAGLLAEALVLFEESRDHFAGRKESRRARIARWSMARVKREQGVFDEALAMQLEIEAENAADGEPDGYCFEELAELYLATGADELATANFAKAWSHLSQDAWFVKNEPERLQRLGRLGAIAGFN